MINPELRRYAWLELSPHRLVTVPLVLLALAIMILASSDKPAEPLAYAALGLFIAVTVGWGTLRAFAGVTNEVRERTWDAQRMAALRPWSLALGKVLGAPLLSWYMGGWCLLVYLIAGLIAGLPHVAVTLVGGVAFGLMMHSLGTAASALTARAALGERGRRAGHALMFVLLVYLIPAGLILGWDDSHAARIHWWLLHGLHPRTFSALSALAFAGWAAFGAWRAMARELREPGWWWAWPAFAAFTTLWFAGVSTATSDRMGLASALGLGSMILTVAAYMGLSLDPLTPVSWARLARVAQAGHAPWHRRWPGWLIHALIALALAALALVAALAAPRALAGGPAYWLQPGPLSLLAPALALMVLRDAAVVCLFTLTTGARKPLARAAFYITVADLLLPALFSATGLPLLAMASFPLWGFVDHPLYPAGGMAVHLAVAAALLWWRRRTSPLRV